MPAAFAMATETLPKEIYEFCGHDGSDIIWPDLGDPFRRRAFHIDEMLDFAISRCYYPVCLMPVPATRPFVDVVPHHLYRPELAERRIHNYLMLKDAVLMGYTKDGKRHAVAWSKEEQMIFDPQGFKISIEEFEIEQIYLIF